MLITDGRKVTAKCLPDGLLNFFSVCEDMDTVINLMFV